MVELGVLGDISEIRAFRIYCALCGEHLDKIHMDSSTADEELLQHLRTTHSVKEPSIRDGKARR